MVGDWGLRCYRMGYEYMKYDSRCLSFCGYLEMFNNAVLIPTDSSLTGVHFPSRLVEARGSSSSNLLENHGFPQAPHHAPTKFCLL